MLFLLLLPFISFSFGVHGYESLSTFRVPMNTEICTPPKILESSPTKWYLVWIITIPRKARIIERLFVESQISCRYPFSVGLYFLIFSLYFQITFWYQHRENWTMVYSLFRQLMTITSGLLWSNLIVVLIILSHQI